MKAKKIIKKYKFVRYEPKESLEAVGKDLERMVNDNQVRVVSHSHSGKALIVLIEWEE